MTGTLSKRRGLSASAGNGQPPEPNGFLSASRTSARSRGDMERFLAFVELTYRDRVIGTAGLAPRRGC